VKQPKLVVVVLIVLVLAGAAATAYFARENFALKLEIGILRHKLEAAAKALPPERVAGPVVEVPAGHRTIGKLTREVMLDALSSETGSEKALWLRVDPQDREAAEFARQIAEVFREVRWEVFVLDHHNLRFKPGLTLLVGAKDSPPSYVETAQRALSFLRDPVAVGTGYVSYYEKMKRESPDWQGGVAFLPGQTYAVYVGRNPEPTPDE